MDEIETYLDMDPFCYPFWQLEDFADSDDEEVPPDPEPQQITQARQYSPIPSDPRACREQLKPADDVLRQGGDHVVAPSQSPPQLPSNVYLYIPGSHQLLDISSLVSMDQLGEIESLLAANKLRSQVTDDDSTQSTHRVPTPNPHLTSNPLPTNHPAPGIHGSGLTWNNTQTMELTVQAGLSFQGPTESTGLVTPTPSQTLDLTLTSDSDPLQQQLVQRPAQNQTSGRAPRRRVPCPVCHRTYQEGGPLKRHLKMMHSKVKESPPERPYVCDSCPSTFKNSKGLKSHMRTIHRSTPLQCPFCPRTCKTSSNMNDHIRTHTGENPYQCPHCGKEFRGRSGQGEHLKREVCTGGRKTP
eukprot:GFYU01026099.1.p1 GENE.GFYU01026099.1~~GFYU01026099.1.p1  ORF type:complete len:375 (+),score=-15.17 GFYU01026099.1:58-1125(+)